MSYRPSKLLAGLRRLFGRGCHNCGYPQELSFGALNYCYDCWPGYQSCADPGCNHYECEHSHGDTWKTVYVKPGMEEHIGYKVGDEIEIPKGCMNAGCPCTGFRTPEEQYRITTDTGQARRETYWALSELDGVERVESRVDTCVTGHTLMVNSTKEQREAVFQQQAKLMAKYPDVVFDFNIGQPQSEVSINDHEQSTD